MLFARALHEVGKGQVDAIGNPARCDVIFMAPHGRRGISKLIAASVTQDILAHSRFTLRI